MKESGRAIRLARVVPPGSKNKKSLALQQMLLEHGEEIIRTLIERAKQGDRVALTLAAERLIPRLKDIAELPFEESQEDSQFTTNQPESVFFFEAPRLKPTDMRFSEPWSR